MSVFYQDAVTQILCGDCLDIMRQMEGDSIDAIVTDPPYGIRFMGKAWDGKDIEAMYDERARYSKDPDPRAGRRGGHRSVASQAGKYDLSSRASRTYQEFCREWAGEALRVMKPGGHLLASCSPRMMHRLTCGLEDAGWEIRDCLMWLYSTGFPKSLNLNREHGHAFCGCQENHDQLRRLRQTENHASSLEEESEAADVQPPMQRRTARQGMGNPRMEGSCGTEDLYENVRPEESGLERRCDVLSQAWELPTNQVRESANLGKTDGKEGRICDGAPPHNGDTVRISLDQERSGPSSGSQPSKQNAEQLGTVADEQRSQTRGAWPICSRCGKPIIPSGLGTALKPAYEPIILARKPLEGTVAQNVLKWGTGAINIDGCRIDHITVDGGNLATNPHLRTHIHGGNGGHVIATEKQRRVGIPNAQGRWPANVLHDGSTEVLAAFPNAPGQLADASTNSEQCKTQHCYGDMRRGRGNEPSADSENTGVVGFNMKPGLRRLDAGSAARFFYTAKATSAERIDPLGEKNTHPTVKPLALMTYLLKLIVPPGGICFDPFMGSGSTVLAARELGMRSIGCDRDEDYVKIAVKRVAQMVLPL